MNKALISILGNSPTPDLATLTKLLTLFNQQTFTTIDIHNQYRMHLDPAVALRRMCDDNEGGICYQINGALSHLLTNIGYKATLHTGWVRASNDIRFDLKKESHMTLLVECDGQQYCVDPGWVDTPDAPLPVTGEIRQKCQQDFRVIQLDDSKRLALQKFVHHEWITQFDFDPTQPKKMHEFSEAADFVYSSEYPFYDNFLCTVTKPDGAHYTLYNSTLLIRYPNGRSEQRDIKMHGGIKHILEKVFNLTTQYIDKLNLANLPVSLQHKLKDSWSAPNNI